jgi:hypothetical protein
MSYRKWTLTTAVSLAAFPLVFLLLVLLAGCTKDDKQQKPTDKGQQQPQQPKDHEGHKDMHDGKGHDHGANGHDHGKGEAHAEHSDEADIAAERAKLSAEDRKLVEAQEYCPIMDDHHLGVMGPPVKLMLKDQPVFVCCKQCQKKALADPDKTLAKVEELKAKVKASASKQ